MQDEKRWITWRGRRILVNNKGNIVKDGYSLQKKDEKENNISKRIYETNMYGNKQFVGYKYKNYKIDVQHDYSLRARGYEGKKWYYTNLKEGKRICTDTLKEMKQEIDDDIQKR